MYIHELPEWPHFNWNKERLAEPLADIRHRQGRLLGHMEALGFNLRQEAILETLTVDVIKSSEIEGEKLDTEQVRSSIARRLGVDIGALKKTDRNVDGIVELMLDAMRNYNQPLTEGRLFGWHESLFPSGRSGLSKITVGGWRDDSTGPMEVVSGAIGKERVHFEAHTQASTSGSRAARAADRRDARKKVMLDVVVDVFRRDEKYARAKSAEWSVSAGMPSPARRFRSRDVRRYCGSA